MTEYTDQERNTLRTAAFGAMMLVSNADPGFFASFKESMAGAKAFATASPELATLLKSGGLPSIPKGSPAEIETSVLTALQQSTQILQTKAPQELDGFRKVIDTACMQVADASKGTNEAEAAAITKVRTAVGL